MFALVKFVVASACLIASHAEAVQFKAVAAVIAARRRRDGQGGTRGRASGRGRSSGPTGYGNGGYGAYWGRPYTGDPERPSGRVSTSAPPKGTAGQSPPEMTKANKAEHASFLSSFIKGNNGGGAKEDTTDAPAQKKKGGFCLGFCGSKPQVQDD